MGAAVDGAWMRTGGAQGKRPRADLNRDRWIQSPECYPLHHEAIDSYELNCVRPKFGQHLASGVN